MCQAHPTKPPVDIGGFKDLIPKLRVQVGLNPATRDVEPLVVKPKAACSLLGCGLTRLYQLIAAGELDSFRDGRSRKIIVASIQRYIERQLARTALSSNLPKGSLAPNSIRSMQQRRPHEQT
jgi:excisionase family DNA binding protein